MIKKEINIIEIAWEGPLTFDEAKEKKNKKDYGIYQIYGTHNIFGENTLLYIGKAEQQEFGVRLAQHSDWIINEQNEIKIYLGRLGGINTISDEEWVEQINIAEKLLIYFCSPPYNSSNINYYEISNDQIVLNFGKKNRIPYEVSTLYKNGEYLNNENWKEFKYIKNGT
jgi:hypothetical protein